jgi:hypothetical protein
MSDGAPGADVKFISFTTAPVFPSLYTLKYGGNTVFYDEESYKSDNEVPK